MPRTQNSIAVSFWVASHMKDLQSDDEMMQLHRAGVYEAKFTLWQKQIVVVEASFDPENPEHRQAVQNYAARNIKKAYGAKNIRDMQVLDQQPVI